MSLPRYAEYKDSGESWLGAVPSHWQVLRLKNLFEIRKRIVGEEGHQVLSITQRGIKVKDIESNDGQLSMDYSKYQVVQPGDFAMNHMDLLTGFVDISSFAGVTSPDYRVFTVRAGVSCEPRYFLHLLQTGYSQKIFYAFGQGASEFGRWRFPTDQFNDFRFPCPPQEEQTAIAAFLDRETAKIDALIAEQEKLIALLAEKRQATISHAVTRGLNPDAPMKDSGVAWLGEVPAHWDVMTFQRCVYVQEGQVDPEVEPYRSMLLIAPNHVESATGRLLYTETAQEQAAESGKYLCKSGDVIYSKIRPALRKVCIAPEDCLCSADMYPLRGISTLSNAFLMWFMLSEPFSALAVLESERVAMPKINRESLKAVWVPVPTLQEQKDIVAFLFVETAKLDALKDEVGFAIELLSERRSALISAAVTGQIDVRTLA